jgi:hypothetical protein
VLGACPIRWRGPFLLIFLLPPSHDALACLHHFACVMTFLCSRAFLWVMIPRSRNFAAVCREKSLWWSRFEIFYLTCEQISLLHATFFGRKATRPSWETKYVPKSEVFHW